jgi:homoserine dehydrogenase
MKQLKVAMLGYGIAGKAFAWILNKTHKDILETKGVDVKIVAITTGHRGSLYCMEGLDLSEATRQMTEDGKFDENSSIYSTLSSMDVVKTVDYDVVLELTPLNIFTGLPAADHIREALKRGKHVVSANKGPLAWNYRELRDLAKDNNACFFFETTVMAGTPVFNMADNCLQFCKIDKIEGILNATTNYILKKMSKDIPIDEIMRAGRDGGFMEADSSLDTEGWDAAAKLTVLMNVLMDAEITPDIIDRTGINGITSDDIIAAREKGNVIKLMCRGERQADGTASGKVAPEEILADDVFADDKLVAVVSLYTDLMGKLTTMQYGIETTQTGYGIFIDTIRVIDNISSK